MKALIVDDEKPCRQVIANYLKPYKSIETILQADSIETALEIIKTDQPDLLFLDIQLSEGTGFDLLDALPERTFQVVFTTAYDDYAIKAFEYSALHYLLKPVEPEEIEKAISRSLNGELKVEEKPLKEAKFLYLKTENRIFNINLSEVTHFEADGSYCKVYFEDGSSIFSAKNLGEFEKNLPTHFYRIHKSVVVNVHAIQEMNSANNEIHLNNGYKVKVSRRKKTTFLALLKEQNLA